MCVGLVEGMSVRLSFDSFALERERGEGEAIHCGFDYVAVYEAYRDENDTQGFLGKFAAALAHEATMEGFGGAGSAMPRARRRW